MPTCKNCKSHFPNRVKINGKTKSIHSRSYCLDCSPFGLRSYKGLNPSSKNSSSKNPCICISCGKKYEYIRSSGHTKKKCNSCMSNSRRHKIKKKCVDYKGGECDKCGYSKCLGALQFHHLDPKEKDFTISGSHTRKWETIKKELDKCILLCANCHTEEHYKSPPREEAVSSVFL